MCLSGYVCAREGSWGDGVKTAVEGSLSHPPEEMKMNGIGPSCVVFDCKDGKYCHSGYVSALQVLHRTMGLALRTCPCPSFGEERH